MYGGGTAEVARGIALAPAGGYCIAEDLATVAQRPARSLKRPAVLDSSDYRQEIGSLDAAYGVSVA
jgi:hypothetical protein